MRLKEITKVVCPILHVGLLFLIIYLWFPSYYDKFAVVVAVDLFEVATGEITSIAAGIGMGLNPIIVAVFVSYIESSISLFVAVNFDLLKKLPKAGEQIIKYENRMKTYMETKKWLKSAGFLGISVVAAIPFYGTGAVPSTILGRLLGMEWKKSWLAVSMGIFLRSMLISLLLYLGYLAI